MRGLLTFVFVVILFAVYGQTDFRIKKISVSDGLSNGRIHDMHQDSLGYMWLATANGITRYSGSSFKKYKLNASQSSLDPSVLKLCSSSVGFFALLQGGSLFRYDFSDDEWEMLFEKPEEIFTSISFLDTDQIVIGTTDGFFTYQIKDGKIGEKQFTELLYIRRIERLDEAIFMSSSKGLHKFYQSATGEFLLQESILKDKDILDFQIDVNKAFWIGTENDGVFKYYQGETQSIEFLHQKQLSARGIALSQDGTTLVAVDGYGLFILDAFGKPINRISYDPDDPNSLSQNSINSIYVDNRAIWLGVGEIGLNLIYRQDNHFENISHKSFSDNTINNDIIRSIYQDGQGELWIGTEGGLTRRDLNGQWSEYGKFREELAAPVLSIAYYNKSLVLGTYGQGLLAFSKETGEVKPYGDKVKLKRVFTTLVDNSTLWVGGLDGPVYHMYKDSVISTYSTGQVKAFAKKDEATMLVGTVEGIYQINSQSKNVSKLQFGGKPIINVYSLRYDHFNQDLWIANDNGLTKYNYQDKTIESVESLNEVSGAIYSILQLSSKELWIAAEKGLFKYSIEEKRHRKYAFEDGQIINEYGVGAKTILLDGRVAFGGPKGAVLFDPDKLLEDDASPKIYIANFEINGAEPENGILQNVNQKKEIRLPYRDNTLTFDVDYLKLHGSPEFYLEWQLIGHDEEVKRGSNTHSVTYRDLKPGQYQLKVSAINADGYASSNSINLSIEIDKPFWFQWWAIIFYVLFVSAITYLVIVVNRARQNKKFSEEKIKFFIDVAHDIRTPVSLIRLASDQLLQNNNIEESVQIINRYTRNLNEYVSELLDFQKSERKKLRIVASELDVVELLRHIVTDFKSMADQKNITIMSDFPESLKVWADKIQLGRIFTNLMSNAIKYNHENGKIWISATSNEAGIQIAFRDSGLGIPKNQIDKIFMRFHRAHNAISNEVRGTGIGLMLSKRIAELHKGDIICESEENIGSTFTVKLLHGTDHYDPNDLRIKDKASAINLLKEAQIQGKKLIMVIEDNEDILSYIKRSFTGDYSLITATDGKEGLFKIIENKPDLIISDVMLPSLNGKEICHIIKNDQNLSGIPVILLTALSGLDDKLAGLEVGADFYLEKPFDINVLKLSVKNLLKRSQLDKEISEKSKKKSSSIEESFLSNVIEIINKNLSNHEFSIDQLCDEVGLSRSNLFRKMKAITGFSPSDLIQEMRLNRAKQLMIDNANIRIEDVAYKSGFNDPKYFSTLFKKHFKMTPSDFHLSKKG
ncbi:MAG: ATP-binding protein [Cyclobacteriaceae bacterium]